MICKRNEEKSSLVSQSSFQFTTEAGCLLGLVSFLHGKQLALIEFISRIFIVLIIGFLVFRLKELFLSQTGWLLIVLFNFKSFR